MVFVTKSILPRIESEVAILPIGCYLLFPDQGLPPSGPTYVSR